jgi:hypothetical protein
LATAGGCVTFADDLERAHSELLERVQAERENR